MSRLHIFINGHVQGVGFRFFTSRTANGLGLKGFVRNTQDGKVEAIAEGPKEVLERFFKLICEGPITARIESVDKSWEQETKEFESFGIRYS